VCEFDYYYYYLFSINVIFMSYLVVVKGKVHPRTLSVTSALGVGGCHVPAALLLGRTPVPVD
jgi:hypothetical protein